jgi:hypothetical protein
VKTDIDVTVKLSEAERFMAVYRVGVLSVSDIAAIKVVMNACESLYACENRIKGMA